MPLNIDLQQIFLHLLNFTILFAALYFLLYAPVKNFMDKRTAYYEGLDRQAKEKLEEAERSRADYRHKLEEADAEIRQKNIQAQQAAQEASQAQLQQARDEAGRILAKAKAEAQIERERVAEEARKDISEMVTVAVEKLVLDTTSSVYDQFLEAAGEEDADG